MEGQPNPGDWPPRTRLIPPGSCLAGLQDGLHPPDTEPFCCPPFPAPDSLLWPDGEVHGHRSATPGAGTEAVCSGDVRPCVYKPHCSTGPARCHTVNTQPPLQGGSDGHGTPRAQGPPALCQGQARSQVPPDTTHNALSQLPSHLRVCRGGRRSPMGSHESNPT